MEYRDLAHFRQQHGQRCKPERHVDPEDHRPMQVFGEDTAEDRSADTRRHPHAAEIGLVLAALARRHNIRNHGLHDRQNAAAAEPLQPARHDQHRHVRRQCAQYRARDEQAHGCDDHGAAAIDVAKRSEHRRDRGRRQEIGRDHPRQAGDIPELPTDGRQRRGDDGLVEGGQKHRQHQAHQDGPDFTRRQRRAWLNRRGVADVDDLRTHIRELARDCFGQCLLISRLTALPFELVHVERYLGNATGGCLGFVPNLGGKSTLRQRVVRMGASRGSTNLTA
ncbi:hypothetical protein GALL_474820 [mine drainage metagenome]|uniref:Uncharacterized protein n=1 Tax=mine drainage metagenome TaxID=410659 RepID=A0A1J5PJC9_9ZZZZ